MLRMDQADLAQQIGVSRLWVSQIEHGKPGASLALVLRALAALGIELAGNAMEEAGGQGDAFPILTPDIDGIVADARRKERP